MKTEAEVYLQGDPKIDTRVLILR